MCLCIKVNFDTQVLKKGRILPYHHQIFRKLCKPLLNFMNNKYSSVTHFRIISLLDWISYCILFCLFVFSFFLFQSHHAACGIFSSLTRVRTHTPYSGSAECQLLDH